MPEPRLKAGLALAGAFCILLGALAWLFLGDTAVAQRISMARLERFRPSLERRLAADPRFKSVRVAVATGTGRGCLLIQGPLARTADLDALKLLTRSMEPPGHVDYRCVVTGEK